MPMLINSIASGAIRKDLANDPLLRWMPIVTKGHSTKRTYAALT